MLRRIWRSRLPILLFILSAVSVSPASETYSPRQYYGAWIKHPKNNYYYRNYYFKPTADYAGYKYHYAMYFPARPNHYYYYNPQIKKYWGRCPINNDGKPLYSLLPEKDRKEKLNEIPDSAFPAPGALPPIPDSEDGAILDLPPNDLPREDLPPNP